jgi:hypothetical protein
VAGLKLGHDAAHVLRSRGAEFGNERRDEGAAVGLRHLLGQEGFDHGEFGGFLSGELGAVALGEHVDGLAALLGHLAQDVGHGGVVVLGAALGARGDVRVLEGGEDQADGAEAGGVAGLHRGGLGGGDLFTEHGGRFSARVLTRLGAGRNALVSQTSQREP